MLIQQTIIHPVLPLSLNVPTVLVIPTSEQTFADRVRIMLSDAPSVITRFVDYLLCATCKLIYPFFLFWNFFLILKTFIYFITCFVSIFFFVITKLGVDTEVTSTISKHGSPDRPFVQPVAGVFVLSIHCRPPPPLNWNIQHQPLGDR